MTEEKAMKNTLPSAMPELGSIPICFIVRYRLPKENHDKVADLCAVGDHSMDYQRMHPGELFYTQSRFFFRPEADTGIEEWFFMDEYDEVAGYNRLSAATDEFVTTAKAAGHQRHYEEWIKLLVPGTTLATMSKMLYVEIESLRVEFGSYKSRAEGLARTERNVTPGIQEDLASRRFGMTNAGNQTGQGAGPAPRVHMLFFRIRRQDHDRMVDACAGGSRGMDYERMHPWEYSYSKSRHFYRVEEGGDTEEWFFMDEYDNGEAWQASPDGPAATERNEMPHSRLTEAVTALILPGSLKETSSYSEIEQLRVQFEPYRQRMAALARLAGRQCEATPRR